MLVVSYGDTILRLLWDGSKFNPSLFHPAHYGFGGFFHSSDRWNLPKNNNEFGLW